jgi:hypothetical protein
MSTLCVLACVACRVCACDCSAARALQLPLLFGRTLAVGTPSRREYSDRSVSGSAVAPKNLNVEKKTRKHSIKRQREHFQGSATSDSRKIAQGPRSNLNTSYIIPLSVDWAGLSWLATKQMLDLRRVPAQFTPHTDSTLSIARHVGERHWKGMDEQWHAAQPYATRAS